MLAPSSNIRANDRALKALAIHPPVFTGESAR